MLPKTTVGVAACFTLAGLLLFAGVAVVLALTGFNGPAERHAQMASEDRLAGDGGSDRARRARTQRVVLGGAKAADRRRAASRRPARRDSGSARPRDAAAAAAPAATATVAPKAAAPSPGRAPAPAPRPAPAEPAPAPAAPPAAASPAPGPAPAQDPVSGLIETTKQTVRDVLPAPVRDTVDALLAPR